MSIVRARFATTELSLILLTRGLCTSSWVRRKVGRRASHTSLEVPGSRQLSICSQLSPVQSRRGSQATSPESIQKARKSNGEKKETASHAHKTHKPDSSEKGAPRATSDAAANGPGSPTVIVARGNSKPSNPNTSVSARV
ncbi:uncharacterized protein CEXT_188701 [Caerostris extrusa]|uniref:Secreted protein n=1 Tax=Caerostris extrusa TaxID=172846 RepID=A0AAV4NM43_CAEEX|nr:uncharacterized protein CEXT_188701 [Caerostris extrusa]